MNPWLPRGRGNRQSLATALTTKLRFSGFLSMYTRHWRGMTALHSIPYSYWIHSSSWQCRWLSNIFINCFGVIPEALKNPGAKLTRLPSYKAKLACSTRKSSSSSLIVLTTVAMVLNAMVLCVVRMRSPRYPLTYPSHPLFFSPHISLRLGVGRSPKKIKWFFQAPIGPA